MKATKCGNCEKYTPSGYSTCLGCGATIARVETSPQGPAGDKPVPAEGSRWGAVFVLGLLAIAAVGLAVAVSPSDPETEYPSAWKGLEGPEFSRISLALGRAHVLGCGEFYYKVSSNRSAIAKVYCTIDGTRWQAHLVNLHDLDVIDVAVDDSPPVSGVGVL